MANLFSFKQQQGSALIFVLVLLFILTLLVLESAQRAVLEQKMSANFVKQMAASIPHYSN